MAWRSRLLGWRGGYSPDAFDWHDRARRHFSYWPTQQDTDSIPEELPPHDPEARLARLLGEDPSRYDAERSTGTTSSTITPSSARAPCPRVSG